MAHERVLQLGLHTAEGWVEVRDGLKAGETLVVKGLDPPLGGVEAQLEHALVRHVPLDHVGEEAAVGRARPR